MSRISDLSGLDRVPYHHGKTEKTRESTDLAKYILLGTNNFSQLQIVKKLELCQDMLINEKHVFFWQKKYMLRTGYVGSL